MGPLSVAVLQGLDAVRRAQGARFDAIGLGPEPTPSRALAVAPGVRLLAYQRPEEAAAAPVLLLVPAPIKASYIFDLEPAVSVVRRARAAGLRVYLVDWQRPGPAQREFGLAAYADRLLLACVDAIAAEVGERRPVLAGHSLGGTLAALFASLHPQRLRGLLLLEAPLRFGAASGAFAPLLALTPPVGGWSAAVPQVPGSLLNLGSILAAPDAFIGERLLDRWRSLADPAALRRHLRVQRWSLDEAPLAARLFEETVELLYRQDAFCRDRLLLDGRPARPRAVTAPLLSMVDPRSRVVPEQSVLALHALAGSRERRVLHYRGDVGVALQHVGVLVGPSAHRTLWPQALDWLARLP